MLSRQAIVHFEIVSAARRRAGYVYIKKNNELFSDVCFSVFVFLIGLGFVRSFVFVKFLFSHLFCFERMAQKKILELYMSYLTSLNKNPLLTKSGPERKANDNILFC